uniref:Sigma factor n=1 Tax=Geranium maderense TaxID=28964 RepID=A0A0G2SWW7_9ROSI|nr:sigma factor [Geranium maderense]
MGIVSVSSSAAWSPLGTSKKFSSESFRFKTPSIVASKEDKPNTITLVGAHEKISLPIETSKKQQKRRGRGTKTSKRLKAVSVEEASPCTSDVDYNEAAAKLEDIYKLSPTTDSSEDEDIDGPMRRRLQRRRKVNGDSSKPEKIIMDNVVRSQVKKVKRLDLDKRIALRRNKDEKMDDSSIQLNKEPRDENEKKRKLVKEHSAFAGLVHLDWKKMKMPPVLHYSEQAWLFRLMQPMKALLHVQEDLQKKLGRTPTNYELADKINVNATEVRKQMEVGRAARNKLIMHNLRLVLFVIKKHFQYSVTGNNFEDLCQAGIQGLITSVDRFEPQKGFRLSTYGLFWIRHAVMKSIKLSSIVQVSYGLQSLKATVQKAKEDLWFKLHRAPTEEELIEKVGITPQRYRDVLRASVRVYSLHAKNPITQDEYINELIDDDVSDSDNQRRLTLLRLALDDVLDSLKPKESLVIRQRFGLDGKGKRTLGEIAGNLNISREMVRKHEMKAMMKLKHPTRIDYIHRYSLNGELIPTHMKADS